MNKIKSKVCAIPNDVFECLLTTSEFYTENSDVVRTEETIQLSFYPKNRVIEMILTKNIATGEITGYHEGTVPSFYGVRPLRNVRLDLVNELTRNVMNYVPV